MKKTRDPYPIANTYHVAYNLVDAATVTVTDLCENLSNNFDTHDEGIVDEMTNIDTRFNNKFYTNIKKRQNEYYLNCKKLKKYKSIKSAYYLEGKHWERYKELGINVGYGYYGKSAEDILEDRKKKKNETAN